MNHIDHSQEQPILRNYELREFYTPPRSMPPTPWDLAPRELATLINDLSEEFQIDANFVGSCVVGALAIACQSNLYVERPCGAKTGVNIFTINRMKSGGGKSTILQKIISPIRDFCEKEECRLAKEYENYNLKREIFVKKNVNSKETRLGMKSIRQNFQILASGSLHRNLFLQKDFY